MKHRYITTVAIASIFTLGIAAHTYAQGQFKTGEPSNSLKTWAETSGSSATKSTQNPPVYSDQGVAIRGADPVAYFSQSQGDNAIIGTPEHQLQWNGTTWYFSSAENRDKFAANPTQYAPQYGGYCAKAVSEGYIASVDPNAWRIYEGKLYLNYSKGVRAQWLRDIPGNIAKGDRNWPGVLNR